MHAFGYVLPFLPHTGLISFVHTHPLGVVALGVVALGVVALGVVAFGVVALGVVALGFCLHGPLALTSTPAHLATHAFGYVLPFLPHTGLISFVHTHPLGLVALGVVALGVVALGGVALGVVALGVVVLVVVVLGFCLHGALAMTWTP